MTQDTQFSEVEQFRALLHEIDPADLTTAQRSSSAQKVRAPPQRPFSTASIATLSQFCRLPVALA